MVAAIDHDLLCVHCRYNLRGLSRRDADCPECGHPAADSLVGDRLRFADRRWLRRLVLGLRLALVGLVLSLFRVDFLLDDVWKLLGWLATLIPVVMLLLGCGLLTSRDPGQDSPEPVFSPRRRARWLGTALVLSGVAAEFLSKGRLVALEPWRSAWVAGMLLVAAAWL